MNIINTGHTKYALLVALFLCHTGIEAGYNKSGVPPVKDYWRLEAIPKIPQHAFVMETELTDACKKNDTTKVKLLCSKVPGLVHVCKGDLVINSRCIPNHQLKIACTHAFNRLGSTFGQSPLDIATKMNNQEIINVLQGTLARVPKPTKKLRVFIR